MNNRTMLVLEEGTCPFAAGPTYSCCYGNFVIFR